MGMSVDALKGDQRNRSDFIELILLMRLEII